LLILLLIVFCAIEVIASERASLGPAYLSIGREC
jgi:hypothetical protein